MITRISTFLLVILLAHQTGLLRLVRYLGFQEMETRSHPMRRRKQLVSNVHQQSQCYLYQKFSSLHPARPSRLKDITLEC